LAFEWAKTDKGMSSYDPKRTWAARELRHNDSASSTFALVAPGMSPSLELKSKGCKGLSVGCEKELMVLDTCHTQKVQACILELHMQRAS